MELKYVATVLVIFVAVLSMPAAAETDCDTHPEPVNPHTCCPIPELISDEMKEKCEDYLVPPLESMEKEGQTADEVSARPRPHPHPHPHLRPHPHPPHHKCLMSCVFNETGILNDEQKLDEANLSEYLATILQEENEEWIPALEASFKTCIVKVEEMLARWAATNEERNASSDFKPLRRPYPGCPMKAGFLAGCVFMETVQNCPASFWNDSDKCNAFKDYMHDCKPQPGRWHKKMANRAPSNENSV